MIDTHAHIQMGSYEHDREEVLNRFRAAGGAWMIVPGVDIESSTQAVFLAQREPDVYAAIGVHPEDCATADHDYAKVLRGLLVQHRDKIAAVGETGLDRKEGTPAEDLQRAAFEEHIQLALESELPVIVHSRYAVTQCLDMIRAFPGLRGVMHCFGGTVQELNRAIDMGFYVSFTGNVTYPGADATREAVKACPFDRLLLETDAPYMPPVPWRGKRNEPSYVKYTYQAVGSLLGKDIVDLSQQLRDNACALFCGDRRRRHARQEIV